MADQEQDEIRERKKRTMWLLAAGSLLLIIPLLGVLYLHMNEGAPAPSSSGRGDLFQRRDTGDRQIVPSQAAVVMPSTLARASASTDARQKPASSSLDFIKSGDDSQAQAAEPPKIAAPAPAPAPTAAATTASTAPPAAAKRPAKPVKKAFAPPKLKSTSGFSSFNSGKSGKAPEGQNPQNPEDVLKNLPPGAADNPEVQKALKNQGQ